ncbi:MAG: hypothetical protein H0X50_01555 [Nitrosopumilus sp.]|nr:hypothetical protein [Nitrosopumilus sp.]
MIYRIFFIVIFSLFLFTAGILSSVNAQLGVNNSSSTNQSTSKVASPQKPNGVRITSPVNGEQILVNGTDYFTKNGENLLIKGLSIYTKNGSSECAVSVIINNVRPYQLTNATGQADGSDYSSWNYNFTPEYLPLKEGPNKITSKLTCQPGNKNAYYSINVTGLKLNETFSGNIKKPNVVERGSTNGTQPSGLNTNSVAPDRVGKPILSPADNTKPTNGTQPSGLNTNSVAPDRVGKPPNVAIVFPKNNERVSVDGPLLVNGTSTYPGNWNCEIFVAVGNGPNVIVPNNENQSNFKKAIAAGKNGVNDYTSWNLSLEPGQFYSKNGSQSLTAKMQCYSPNQFMKTAKVNIVAESSKMPETRSMDIGIDKIGNVSNQKIVITVHDLETDEPIIGASLSGKINDDSFSGITNSNGEFSKGLSPSSLASSSTMEVTVTSNADGYKSKKASTSFDMSSSAVPTVTTKLQSDAVNRENDANTDIRENNNKELAEEIINEVQNKLSDQGINIPLPFN